MALVSLQVVEDGRVQAHLFHELRHGQDIFPDQVGDTKSQCGFQADDAARCFGKRFCFLLCAVRCVVGGNDVDDAFLSAAENLLFILKRAKRRVHFRQGAVF